MDAPTAVNEDLLYVVEGGIAHLTFTRPQARPPAYAETSDVGNSEGMQWTALGVANHDDELKASLSVKLTMATNLL